MRVDAADNRERIIEAYLRLVAPANPDPRMDDVATTAGLARGTLYRHFSDRNALRRAAHIRVLDDTEQLMRDVVERREPVDQALSAVVRESFDRVRLLQLLTSHQDYFDHRIARRWTRWKRPLIDLVRTAQDRGDLRADQPADWLVDTLLWIVYAIGMSGTPSAHRDPAGAALSLFFDGARRR
ncbi:TetR/AcrR family transcriptional regulator [Nocardia mexicana]|uniref:TetR family transcriptional regulator n=1 Tax=Nocardia mexicana TaxID=279262 RepID=A0A370GRT2_9NOCA|nr:TetR/AcrR family transcriptional regulator [Nocardia mexicana]RDI46417.1 TetR family transcriptional regulator [Nocardia mexicana]